MIKIFCDRCNTEIKNHDLSHKFSFQDSSGAWENDGVLCDDCYKSFVSFMKMKDSMYHNNPGNNHGIERTTIGAR